MANLFTRLYTGFRRFVKSVVRSDPGQPAHARNARASALRPYLAGAMPGLWATNHNEEANRYTGYTFCAVSAKAEQAAAASVIVYHVSGDRRKKLPRRMKKSVGGEHQEGQDRTQLDDKNPLVRLMHRPNPDQSGRKFRFQCAQQIGLTGTALVWIVRSPDEVPVELYVIPTGSTTPLAPTTDHPRGSYRVAPLASFALTASEGDDFLPPGSLGPLMSTGAVLDARDVKAIRWPHSLYLSDGWGPLAAGALTIDVAEQLDRSRWYYFKNTAQPGMVLSMDDDANPPPEEMEAFRQDLRNRNAGTANAGKDLLLPPGIKAEQIAHSPTEMDHTGSYPQVRDAVLALHKCPPVAIGVTEAGSYAAFYASLKQFVELSVQPLLDLIAEELTEAIGPDFERVMGLPQEDRLLISFTAKSIDDPTLLESRLQNDRAAKTITVNEWRAQRGMEPVWWGECPVGTDFFEWKQKEQQAKQGGEGKPGEGQGKPGADGGAGGEDGEPTLAEILGEQGGGDGGGEPQQPGGDVGEGSDPTLGEVLGESGDQADSLGDDESTGVRNPTQDAVPGRPVSKKFRRLVKALCVRGAAREAMRLVQSSRDVPDEDRAELLLWIAKKWKQEKLDRPNASSRRYVNERGEVRYFATPPRDLDTPREGEPPQPPRKPAKPGPKPGGVRGGKGDPAEVAAKLKAIQASEITEDNLASALDEARRLLVTLTGKQVGELSQGMGGRKTGRKDRLVELVLELAQGKGRKKWQRAGKPAGEKPKAETVAKPASRDVPAEKPAPQPKPAKPPAKPASEGGTWKATVGAFQQMEQEFRNTGELLKIPRMYDLVKGQVPGITRDQFHQLLQKWQKENKLTLQVCNDPHMEQRASEGIQSDRGVLLYVELNPDAIQPAPQPAKPAAKPIDPAPILRDLADAEGPEGIHDAFEAAKGRDPSMTLGRFHDTLRDLERQGAVEPVRWQGPLLDVENPSSAMLVDNAVVTGFKPTGKKPGPVNTPAPVDLGKLAGEAATSIQGHAKRSNTDMPLSDLYADLRKSNPTLTAGQFEDAMRQLSQDGKVVLTHWGGPLLDMPKGFMPIMAGHKVKAFVHLPESHANATEDANR